MFGGGFGSKLPGKGNSKKSDIIVVRGSLGLTNDSLRSKSDIVETAKRKLSEGVVSVKWNSPLTDGSGYAEAARNYVAALHSAGVDVSAKSITFDGFKSDYGRAGLASFTRSNW